MTKAASMMSRTEKRREWMREYIQSRRQRAKRDGMCVLCFKEHAVEGKTCCPKCLALQCEKQKAYAAKHRVRGKVGRPRKNSPDVVRVTFLNSYNYATNCDVIRSRKKTEFKFDYNTVISISI